MMEPFLFIFILVDVRKDDATINGHFDLAIRMGIFRHQVTVLFNLVHDLAEIIPYLLDGVFSPFFFSFDVQREILRIGSYDLV